LYFFSHKHVVLASLVVMLLLGCSSNSADSNNNGSIWKVKYEVVVEDTYGTNQIYSIQYNDDTDTGIWVGDSPDSPWVLEFTTDQSDFPVYLGATPMRCDGPCPDFTVTITVNVYVDDVLIQSESDPDEAIIDDTLENLLNPDSERNDTGLVPSSEIEHFQLIQDNGNAAPGEDRYVEYNYSKSELSSDVLQALDGISTTTENLFCSNDGTTYEINLTDSSGDIHTYVSNNRDCGRENEIVFISIDDIEAILPLFEYE